MTDQYLDIVLTDQVQHEDKIVIYATKYFNKVNTLAKGLFYRFYIESTWNRLQLRLNIFPSL